MRVFIYGAIFALAALGMVPGALFMGLLALVVPGLILALAPNLALYLPFADFARAKRKSSAAMAFAPLLALAFGLPIFANLALGSHIAIARSGDFAKAGNPKPRRLLLYAVGREKRFLDGWRYYGHVNQTSCDEACARLLLSGEVEAILRPKRTAREPIDLDRGYTGQAVVYSLDRGGLCPTADLAVIEAGGELAAMAASQCLVARVADHATFDAALTTIDESRHIARFNPFDPGVAVVSRRTTWRCAGDHCQPVARITSVGVRRLAAPLMIGWEGGPDLHMLRELWRIDGVVNATTDAAQLAEVFHLNPGAPPRPDPARLRAAAERALSDSARDNRRLSEAEVAAIDYALKPMADSPRPLSEDDLRFLSALVTHPTANWFSGLSAAVRDHPEAMARLAPEVVTAYDRITAGGEGLWQNDMKTSLSTIIAGFPPEILAREKSRILKAAGRPKALANAEMLIAALGGMGPEAAPVLAEGLNAGGDEIVQSALALCRLGRDGTAAAPALVALRGKAAFNDWLGATEKISAINLALARMGRGDLARQPLPDRDQSVPPATVGPRRPSHVFADVSPATSPEICVEKSLR